jgi:hypothetical protein
MLGENESVFPLLLINPLLPRLFLILEPNSINSIIPHFLKL